MKIQVVRSGSIYAKNDTCLEVEGVFGGATISESLVVIFTKEEKKP